MFSKPNKLLLFYYKIESINAKLRIIRLRKLGMKIGHGSVLGKTKVLSPNSVIIGNNCEIRDDVIFWIKNPFSTVNGVIIGNNNFIGSNVEFNCCGRIQIGNNCLIASNVIFVDSGHGFLKNELINSQPTEVKNILVEDDVWIGSGSIILKGVTIGKGAVIGANSVVNKTVPDFEIWGGSPAKRIKDRIQP